MANANDVDIPVPMGSGATDQPDVPQHGVPAVNKFSGVQLDMSKSQPLAPSKFSGVKLDMGKSTPLSPDGTSLPPAAGGPPKVTPPVAPAPAIPAPQPTSAVGRYGQRLGQSLGIPTNKEELTAAGTPPSMLEAAVGPGVAGAAKQIWQSGKTLYQGAKDTAREAQEAGQNIAAGGPVLQNIAKPASTALNATVGAVPFIGAPTVQAGEDVAAKNYAGAAGGLTGVLGQVALEGAGERRLGTDEMAFHDAKVKEATAALKEAKKAATTNYKASIERDIKLPKEVQKPIDTAQAALDEAKTHQAAAKEAIAQRKVAPPAPEVPTEQVQAQPQAPRPPTPTMRKLGPAEPPKPPMRVMEVPPEAAPSANAETAPKAETPTAPVAEAQHERGTDRRQATVPVEQERRVTERRNPAGIRVDAEGNPTMSPDVQAHWQGSALGEKPAEDIGAKAREANPEPTRAETKGEAAKPTSEDLVSDLRKVKGANPEVVGSQATGKATGSSDTDLRMDLSNDRFKKEVQPNLEGKGYEWQGSSVVTPKEAAAYDKPIREGWNRIEHFQDANGKRLDVWLPETAPATERAASLLPSIKPAAVEEQLNRGLGNEPVKPGVPMKEQGKPAEPVKISSEPRKAVLQKAGATDEEIAKILPKGAKPGQTGITKVEMSKLAEHFGVDMGDSAIGRGKGDLAAGTHMTQDAVLQKIIDAGHSPADIAKAMDEGKHLATVAGGAPEDQLAEHEKNGGSTFSADGKDLNGTDKYSVGAYPDRTEHVDNLTTEKLEEFKKKNSDVLSKEDHAVGTWKDPDTGKAVLDVAKTYADRDEAIAAGKAANQKSIYHLGGEGEIQTGGTGRQNAAAEKPAEKFPTSAYEDKGDGMHEVRTGPGNSLGHLTAQDLNDTTVQEVSHWVAKDARGKGLGAQQLETLSQSLPKEKTTLVSDELSPSAEGAWKKFQSQYPDAVTKDAKGGYKVDLRKMRGEEPAKTEVPKEKPAFNPNKFHTTTMEKPGAKKSPMRKMQ